MDTLRKTGIILIAEDDDDQYELTSSALSEFRTENRLKRVVDGEQLMDYLLNRGEYNNPFLYPRPNAILLDLNMPKKDGREVLAEIKTDEILRSIPVVILTTSDADDDVAKAYHMYANCYIRKPIDLNRFIEVIKIIENFWLTIVQLPPK